MSSKCRVDSLGSANAMYVTGRQMMVGFRIHRNSSCSSLRKMRLLQLYVPVTASSEDEHISSRGTHIPTESCTANTDGYIDQYIEETKPFPKFT